MKVLNNKKGFTLVELLAVIVVLAIIILIASSSVGGAMTNARKSALAIEGNELVNAAKSAYQLNILDGKVKSGKACFSLQYLSNNGYFEKSKGDGYTGSVLITPNGNTMGYKFWISNGSYMFKDAEPGVSGSNAEPVTGDTGASTNCGGNCKSADGCITDPS